MHFGLTNFTTALAADQVWFNSEYHRHAFLDAAGQWLSRMPDFVPRHELAEVREKSSVQSPGVDVQGRVRELSSGPLRIAWAARWEHDKDPATFFHALHSLKERRLDFRLVLCGRHASEVPAEFARARQEFADHIDHWGYVPDRDEYLKQLGRADVIVSTAIHEFFGLAVMETITLGLYPLLPDRLSYPELLGRDRGEDVQPFLYDGTAGDLAARLANLARNPAAARAGASAGSLKQATARYSWSRRARAMDEALDQVSARDRRRASRSRQ